MSGRCPLVRTPLFLSHWGWFICPCLGRLWVISCGVMGLFVSPLSRRALVAVDQVIFLLVKLFIFSFCHLRDLHEFGIS
ncbi:hypothetical protein HAT2_00118 [Candidatus Similichlamydia laticola]|uniref:Uncharacterized protein n=1 Tax=Candidatus Similichlamydia laticola TaxID=2170265 RepID=A0A369KCV7_9BACT|nr:hypothetical protein HAT2_00118 [Candidatus Similichlamydia laticola]